MQKLTLCLLVASLFSFKAHDKIKPSDLDVLKGNRTGTLTYPDYSSNKKTTIPCDLSILQPATDKRV